MCGIYCQVSNQINKEIKERFDKLKHRGPEFSYFNTFPFGNSLISLGFHRLCIHGLNSESNQPFFYPNETNPEIAVMCNGEIYNYQEIQSKFMLTKETDSDCEIILKMFIDIQINISKLNTNVEKESESFDQLNINELTFEKFLKELKGVYAFLIIDFKNLLIYQGRDHLGIRPLFRNKLTSKGVIFASEGKAIKDSSIQVEHGELIKYNFSKSEITKEIIATNKVIQFDQKVITSRHFLDNTIHTIKSMIVHKLREAVKLQLTSDRPIGVLLSGGLDSSLIAAIAQQESKEQLKTFSIAIVPDDLILKTNEELKEICPDVYYSEKVAEYIKTEHYTIKIKESEALNSLENVIKTLETNDTTTIRASTGMYLISKWISENTNVKVLLSGEGSDELFGGYLYFHSAPNEEEFQKETERLINDLKYFDLLRGDRSTAAWGLELRVPFLNKELVDYVISLEPKHKMKSKSYIIKNREIEKWLLRSSFEFSVPLLPNEILWRQKDAFSDAVGYNWVTAIKGKCEKEGLTEDEYYKKICKKWYKKVDIPYKWMPRWIKTTDPSARTLTIHKNKM